MVMTINRRKLDSASLNRNNLLPYFGTLSANVMEMDEFCHKRHFDKYLRKILFCTHSDCFRATLVDIFLLHYVGTISVPEKKVLLLAVRCCGT